jgi:hypothetical protein
MLVNVECHIAGYEKPLSGGRDFLESLVAVVSDYAQEFLSGIHRPPLPSSKPALVQLRRVGSNLHRLVTQPADNNVDVDAAIEPTQIDLTTVQLFDLVEAVDQLFADTQTLPDLQRQLSPLSKRHVAAAEPVAKRAVPAAVGVSSLAAAAALLFFLPVPEVRRPEPAASSASEEAATASPDAIGADRLAASSPPDPAASPSPTSPPETISSSPSSAAEAETETETETETVAPPDPAQVDALLNQAPVITNAAEIRQLTLQLREQLDEAWTADPTFDQDLVYRVGVAENGDILGFKYVNDAAITHVDQTPLLDLRYNPTDPDAPSLEPIAQLRVVFTPGGVVQVSPWHGYPQ